MKKTLLSLALVAVSGASMADTVRLSDGSSCSFDADDNPWEISLEGKNVGKNNDGSKFYKADGDSYNDYSDSDEQHIGLKLSYSFGGPKRLDCSKLYNIQLNTKDAELKLLQQKLEILQSNALIDWENNSG